MIKTFLSFKSLPIQRFQVMIYATFKLKNENPSADFSVLELTAFYNAIQIFYNLREKARKKNKTMSTSEIKEYGNFLIKSSIMS